MLPTYARKQRLKDDMIAKCLECSSLRDQSEFVCFLIITVAMSWSSSQMLDKLINVSAAVQNVPVLLVSSVMITLGMPSRSPIKNFTSSSVSLGSWAWPTVSMAMVIASLSSPRTDKKWLKACGMNNGMQAQWSNSKFTYLCWLLKEAYIW